MRVQKTRRREISNGSLIQAHFEEDWYDCRTWSIKLPSALKRVMLHVILADLYRAQQLYHRKDTYRNSTRDGKMPGAIS